ncbi:hypothetical protein EV182_005256 [Spiromyces aspiralis]|uniref:Uncharacterized protein n=1 Tax=Spiromyces aspiralis TaxID=68401 RepID=A0ACC1HCJ1_9FUNG|nr:hypothetical protein EV182_005256 [Spiromyces aspiralis]
MQVGKSTVVSQEDDLGDEFSSERNGHRKNNSTKSVVAAPPNTADKEAKKARRMTSINQNSRRLSAVQT